MTIEKALVELIEKGATIKQIATNEFLVTDNGFFGFINVVDPFVVDGEELLEIHSMYIEE
jgi:hypothetical protein